ncbi:MAG: SDR family NAD(P)-dependent oxidoreductase [Steroidobacteraceae bacterium]
MRNVIVTGASRGLGLEICKGLVTEGYHVIGVARQATPQLQAAMDSAAQGEAGALSFRACDLAQTSHLGAFVGALRKEFGPRLRVGQQCRLGHPRDLESDAG